VWTECFHLCVVLFVCRFRAREAAKKAQEAEKDALQNVVCA
jgi:cbb3-type cytochrome oxidase subunit 3